MNMRFYLCWAAGMAAALSFNGFERLAQEAGSFIPVDISRQVNRNFRNWDNPSGPTANNLADFPVGSQTFLGIPFAVIDPDKNDGRSCIILKDSDETRRLPDFPRQVVIDVHQRCAAIAFLHTSTYGVNVGNEIGQYVIEYDTAAQEVIAIIPGVKTAPTGGSRKIPAKALLPGRARIWRAEQSASASLLDGTRVNRIELAAKRGILLLKS